MQFAVIPGMDAALNLIRSRVRSGEISSTHVLLQEFAHNVIQQDLNVDCVPDELFGGFFAHISINNKMVAHSHHRFHKRIAWAKATENALTSICPSLYKFFITHHPKASIATISAHDAVPQNSCSLQHPPCEATKSNHIGLQTNHNRILDQATKKLRQKVLMGEITSSGTLLYEYLQTKQQTAVYHCDKDRLFGGFVAEIRINGDVFCRTRDEKSRPYARKIATYEALRQLCPEIFQEFTRQKRCRPPNTPVLRFQIIEELKSKIQRGLDASLGSLMNDYIRKTFGKAPAISCRTKPGAGGYVVQIVSRGVIVGRAQHRTHKLLARKAAFKATARLLCPEVLQLLDDAAKDTAVPTDVPAPERFLEELKKSMQIIDASTVAHQDGSYGADWANDFDPITRYEPDTTASHD